MSYFNYCQGLTMTNGSSISSSAGRPASPSRRLEQRHMDLAASIQAVTEEVVLRLGRARARANRHEKPGPGRRRGPQLCGQRPAPARRAFDDLWIQPAAGDAGGALGAALFVWHQLLDKPPTSPTESTRSKGSFLGPSFTAEEVDAFLGRPGRHRATFADDGRAARTRRRAARRRQGRRLVPGPHGVRARGPWAPRSILGDPRSPAMQATMNLKIKFRESFRPFAPAVLREQRLRVVRL